MSSLSSLALLGTALAADADLPAFPETTPRSPSIAEVSNACEQNGIDLTQMVPGERLNYTNSGQYFEWSLQVKIHRNILTVLDVSDDERAAAQASVITEFARTLATIENDARSVLSDLGADGTKDRANWISVDYEDALSSLWKLNTQLSEMMTTEYLEERLAIAITDMQRTELNQIFSTFSKDPYRLTCSTDFRDSLLVAPTIGEVDPRNETMDAPERGRSLTTEERAQYEARIVVSRKRYETLLAQVTGLVENPDELKKRFSESTDQ